MDDIDLRLLSALQEDGRLGYAELGRRVSMSPSSVAERVRRMEENGVITGYTAVVDPERIGLSVLALVRLRYPTNNYKPCHDLIEVTPEIVEAHHVTGEDCFVLKVYARSMRHLEETVGRIASLGPVTTNIVFSSPLERRAVTEALSDRRYRPGPKVTAARKKKGPAPTPVRAEGAEGTVSDLAVEARGDR